MNITARENYLIAFHGGKPHWVPDYFNDTFSINLTSKLETKIRPDGRTEDFLGVIYSGNQYGIMPDTSHVAWKEVSDWRNYKFPDVDSLDWEAEREWVKKHRDPNKALEINFGNFGMFLQLVNAMGWEEGLCALYEDPEEVKAFNQAYTNFLLDCIDHMAEYYEPDSALYTEDNASKQGPFFSREIFRDVYRPYLQQIIDRLHYHNIGVHFHHCADMGYLLEEYLEMGVQCIHNAMPCASLDTFREKHGSKIAIVGAWDSRDLVGKPDCTEEEMRATVREAFDKYAPQGGYIFTGFAAMGFTPESLVQQSWVDDEAEKLRYTYYGKKSPKTYHPKPMDFLQLVAQFSGSDTE